MAQNETIGTKKRKMGRLYEVMKKMNLQSHEFGEFCKCKRLKCTDNISDNNKKRILEHFNSLLSHNEQNAYLCSLISLVNIQRRRSRAKDKHDAIFHDSSYLYRVRIKPDVGEGEQVKYEEVQVCSKFFQAVHGITGSKLQHLQKALKMSGVAPTDRRGGVNYNKLKPDVLDTVQRHIKSFKARKSHYSLQDNSAKTYLPETLNISKMFSMFKDKYLEVKVSYQTYREIFRKDFNLGFGYPRSDTCSQYDEFNVKMKAVEKNEENQCTEISELKLLKEIHLRKAQTFYDRKKACKRRARIENNFEAIAMDYQKNVSLPNISTNDAYYRRQLSMYSFNIHVLSSSDSYFYTYPEFTAKKGSDEVCSFLFHFIMHNLSPEVQHLHIFCDGAGGQNKNYTVVRFIHYMVTVVKRLQSITITYPVRGHSYLECDKNMGLINLKKRMETPTDWEENIKFSRIKPTPFYVISVTQDFVRGWSTFFKDKYARKCPFAMQEMKEIITVNSHFRTIFHRDSYNGLKLEDPIRSSVDAKKSNNELRPLEFELPMQSYFNVIPINEEKYKDIVFLSKFCESKEAKEMYMSIPYERKKIKNIRVTNNENPDFQPAITKRQRTERFSKDQREDLKTPGTLGTPGPSGVKRLKRKLADDRKPMGPAASSNPAKKIGGSK